MKKEISLYKESLPSEVVKGKISPLLDSESLQFT